MPTLQPGTYKTVNIHGLKDSEKQLIYTDEKTVKNSKNTQTKRQWKTVKIHRLKDSEK